MVELMAETFGLDRLMSAEEKEKYDRDLAWMNFSQEQRRRGVERPMDRTQWLKRIWHREEINDGSEEADETEADRQAGRERG